MNAKTMLATAASAVILLILLVSVVVPVVDTTSGNSSTETTTTVEAVGPELVTGDRMDSPAYSMMPLSASADAHRAPARAPAETAAPTGTPVSTKEEATFNKGGTYYLTADISMSYFLYESDLTIDLNGHTLTVTGAVTNYLIEPLKSPATDLTIKDSAGDGTLILNIKSGNTAAGGAPFGISTRTYLNNYYGPFVLESGNIVNTGVGGAILSGGKDIVTINGGSINGGKQNAIVGNGATINGGEITSEDGYAVLVYGDSSRYGNLTINGGSFSGATSPIRADSYSRTVINDGTFVGTNLFDTTDSNDYKCEVNGGWFSMDPSKYVPSTRTVQTVERDGATWYHVYDPTAVRDFTATFALGDGNGTVPEKQTVNGVAPVSVTMPSCDAVRTSTATVTLDGQATTVQLAGKFAGWSDGTKVYQPGETASISDDATFTATYEAPSASYAFPTPEARTQSYTVTFATDGGNAVDPIVAEAPMAFGGWSDGTTTYAGGQEVALTADLAATSQWTVGEASVTLPTATKDGREVTVSFAANGGPELAPVVGHTAYALTAWKDGTETFAPGDSLSVTADRTLTAEWSADESPAVLELPEAPTREGSVEKDGKTTTETTYAFAYFEAADGTRYDAGSAVSESGNSELTARWYKTVTVSEKYLDDYEKTLVDMIPLLLVAGLIIMLASGFVLRDRF